MKRVLLVTALLLAFAGVRSQDFSGLSVAEIPGTGKGILLIADMNGDGLPDVVQNTGPVPEPVAGLHIQQPDGSFLFEGIGIPALEHPAMAVADLNGSGRPDLVCVGKEAFGEPAVWIFLQNVDNTFSVQKYQQWGVEAANIVVTDLESDGKPDIVFSGFDISGRPKMWHIVVERDGSLQATDIIHGGLGYGRMVAFDRDRDGVQELLVSGLTMGYQSEIRLLVREKGTYQQHSVEIPHMEATFLQVADFDLDGYPDVIAGGKKRDGTWLTALYNNNKGMGFSLQHTFPEYDKVLGTLLDMDADGLMDVVLAGRKEDIRSLEVFRNTDTGFDLVYSHDTPIDEGTLVTGYMQGDARPDVLVSGNADAGRQSFWLRNNSSADNASPEFTGAGTCEVFADSVVIFCGTAKDATVPTEALAFDLFIQDQRGDWWVKSLHSHPAGDDFSLGTGMQATGRFVLEDLADGKYTWQRRVVDPAGKASTLETGGTFYVSAPLNLPADSLICPEKQFTVEIEREHTSCEWFRNPEAPELLSSSQVVTFVPEDSDSLWVEITTPYGDILQDTMAIHFYQRPEYTALTDKQVCQGREVTLEVQGNFSQWQWQAAEGAVGAEPAFGFIPTHDQRVYYWLTDNHACVWADSLDVTVYEKAEVNMPVIYSACLHQELMLEVTGNGDQYQWKSELFGDMEAGNSLAYSLTAPDSITVTATTANGCVATTGTRLTPYALPEFEPMNDTLICRGSEAVLQVKSAADDYEYHWGEFPDAFTLEGATHLITPDNTTRYYVQATSAHGCVSTDSVLVSWNTPVQLSVGKEQQEICPGETVMLGGAPTATGSSLPCTYQWWTADSEFSVDANPEVSPIATTRYWLEIRTADCVLDTLTTEVVVHEIPPLEVMADTIVGFEEPFTLWAKGAANYIWSPSEMLTTSQGAKVEARVKETTHFEVTAFSTFGCSAHGQVEVMVKNALFIPEMFSPNSDGRNDYFRVYGFGVRTISLQIFSLAGDKVWEADGIEQVMKQGWPGNDLPEGKYIWLLSGSWMSGEPLQFKGRTKGMLQLVR